MVEREGKALTEELLKIARLGLSVQAVEQSLGRALEAAAARPAHPAEEPHGQ